MLHIFITIKMGFRSSPLEVQVCVGLWEFIVQVSLSVSGFKKFMLELFKNQSDLLKVTL